MAVTLSGMTLLTDNDTNTGWDATTDGIDTYGESEQGVNSQSWQIRKNEDLTALLTQAAAMPTGRGIFVVWLKSDVKKFYNLVEIILRSSAGNEKAFTIATNLAQLCDGIFRAFALDYVNKGTETGTYVPGSHTVMGWHLAMQNVNFRAIVNNWCDAIYYGAGHAISGTTDTDKCFTEAAAIDQQTANKYGVLEDYEGVIYSQGDISLNGTALVSIGETLVFKETPNGYDRLNLNGTGTFTGINTNIQSSGAADFDMDMSSMTAFSMTGGTITGANVLTLIAAQTLAGVVLTDVASIIAGNIPQGATFNQCGQIQVTNQLDACTINESTTSGSSAVTVDNTNRLINRCKIIRDTAVTTHATELTGVAATYIWDVELTGFDAGVTGTGVQVTGGSITGNEAIHIPAATGTFEISVADGATVPSVSTGGAIVNVTSGQKTLTIKGWVTGSQLIIYDDNSADPQELGDELQRNGNIVADETFTYDPVKIGDDIVIVMIPPTNAYKTIQDTVTLGASDANYTLRPTQETN